MGKVQKKKATRRHNPMRVPDSHIPKGLQSAASSTQPEKVEAVLPIIQKLGSTDVAERTWACAAVSNLIQNDAGTRRLLQGKNVVGELINRLNDESEEVVAEAAGALRNLCIDGGFDICGEMFNKRIMQPLESFIPKISKRLQTLLDDPKAVPENAQSLVYDFSENVITILWCLSETSGKALNAVNALLPVPFLMSFLINRARLPTNVVYAAAQCLYVLSDDNPWVIESLRSNSEYVACLAAICKSQPGPNDDERDVGIRVLSSGALRHISTDANVVPVDIDQSVTQSLLPLLNCSLQDTVLEVQHTLAEPPAPPPNPSLKNAKLPKSDHKTPAEIALERIERRLRVLQLALEIFTGICARIPEPERPGDEIDDEDMEGEGDGDIVENGDDDSMGAEEETPSNLLPESDSTSIFSLQTFVPALISLSTPTPMSFPSSSAVTSATITSTASEPCLKHPPITSALVSVHLAALECLSNFLLSFPAADSGPVNPAIRDTVVAAWPQAWSALRTVLHSVSTDSNREAEVSVAALGALWGLARLGRGAIVPTQEYVETLVRIADSTGAEKEVQVKCVEILGSLAQNTGEIEMNRIISQYLLSFIHPTPRATEPTLHALSLLIDIYAEETNPYDINFRNARGTDVLASSIATIRKLVRGIDKRKEGGLELRRWADEVEANVRGFVMYRRKLKI